jgi:Leucine-rich repeat (LRR) protein
MDNKIKILHDKLIEAYSGKNLNRIAVTLISLYKDQNFGTLGEIARLINETANIGIDAAGTRYFPKLMMMYHPDRGQYHRSEIERLANEGNYDELLQFSHILLLERLDEIAPKLAMAEDIDYSPVYEWDLETEGFRIMDLNTASGPSVSRKTKKIHRDITFFEAFQRRMLGSTEISFPSYYFEDIEEFELSQSGIGDLQGVQYCIHARELDLSGNAICDISLLWGLSQLENLNLSDNRIEVIDTVSNLQNVRILNLSYNPVSDIYPLLQMPRLEYVELTGTKVSRSGIKELEELGVTVISD